MQVALHTSRNPHLQQRAPQQTSNGPSFHSRPQQSDASRARTPCRLPMYDRSSRSPIHLTPHIINRNPISLYMNHLSHKDPISNAPGKRLSSGSSKTNFKLPFVSAQYTSSSEASNPSVRTPVWRFSGKTNLFAFCFFGPFGAFDSSGCFFHLLATSQSLHYIAQPTATIV
jgi:hypothetical protein